MPAELLNLLVQLPFIAVFIWYVTRRDEREVLRWERQQQQFTETLDRRQAMVDRLTDVVAANTQAMLTLKSCLDSQKDELERCEGPITRIETHAVAIREKLDAHHEAVMRRKAAIAG